MNKFSYSHNCWRNFFFGNSIECFTPLMPELAAPYNYKANSNSKFLVILVWDLLVRNIYLNGVGNEIIHRIFLWFHYLPTTCLSVRAAAIIDTRCLIQVTASKAKNPSATNVPVHENYHASPRQKKENKWGVNSWSYNFSANLKQFLEIGSETFYFFLVSNVS